MAVKVAGMVGSLFVAAFSMVRRHVAEPGMPQMSSEWLLSHEMLVGRRTGW